MADTSGMADIRGLKINSIIAAYEESVRIFRNYVRNATTPAREIRWWQKTNGILDSTDTTGITASQIANTDFGALPVVVEQSWTRQTSYVRKYAVQSPSFPIEDIDDSPVNVWATNVRDLMTAVEQQVNVRIWDILTESRSVSQIQEVAITNEWDDYTNCNPISDLLSAAGKLRDYNFKPEGSILFLNNNGYTYLLSWLINTKGTYIPSFASEKVSSGMVTEIMGFKIVVDPNVTSDYGLVMAQSPIQPAVYEEFTPMTSAVVDEPGVGKTIRIWCVGEAILEYPKGCVLLSNLGPT